jgi:hypothetical protein
MTDPMLLKVHVSRQNDSKEETWWQEAYASILDTIREYPDQPIFSDNVRDTLWLADDVLSRAVTIDQAPSTPTLDVIFRCLDWVTTTDDKQGSLYYDDRPKLVF